MEYISKNSTANIITFKDNVFLHDQKQVKKLRVIELQRRLNSQSYKVSDTNINTLIATGDEVQSLWLQDYPQSAGSSEAVLSLLLKDSRLISLKNKERLYLDKVLYNPSLMVEDSRSLREVAILGWMQSSLGIRGGLVLGPLQIPKAPYIKWHSIRI